MGANICNGLTFQICDEYQVRTNLDDTFYCVNSLFVFFVSQVDINR